MVYTQNSARPAIIAFLAEKLPLEVAVIALILLGEQLRVLVYFGFQLLNYLAYRGTPAAQGNQFFGWWAPDSEAIIPVLLALAAMVIGIALLQLRPWARQAGLALALVLLWTEGTAILQSATMGMAPIAMRALIYLRTAAQLAAVVLFFALCLYVLTRSHIKEAFGEPDIPEPVSEPDEEAVTDIAETEEDEETPAHSLTAADVEREATARYNRWFGADFSYALALIAAFLLRDGMADIYRVFLRFLFMIYPPFAETFIIHKLQQPDHWEELMVAAVFAIGLLGVATGIGLLRRTMWAGGLAVFFLILSCLIPLKSVIEAYGAPTGFIHRQTAAASFMITGAITIALYLILLALFKQMQPAQRQGTVVF